MIDYEDIVPSESNFTVKDLPTDEQPRERLLKYGVASLSNADLLAIILRTGTSKYPITDLCRDLMRQNDNLFLNLERKTRDEIMEIKGIGELKAMQVEAVMEIVRRYHREQIGNRIRIRSAANIFEVMKYEIGNLPYEEMWALLLNQSNCVVGKVRLSQGGSTATVFDVKKLIRTALNAHAEAVILTHNHPSGNLRPSAADDKVTRICLDACRAMDLKLLDHVIVTSDGYYSYSDSSSILQ